MFILDLRKILANKDDNLNVQVRVSMLTKIIKLFYTFLKAP
jgi:hypothetical protein